MSSEHGERVSYSTGLFSSYTGTVMSLFFPALTSEYKPKNSKHEVHW